MLDAFLGFAVLGGVASQSLMDLGMICISLHFIYSVLTKKISLKDLKPTGIEWAFAGYFVTAIISLLINGKPPIPWGFYLMKFNWIPNFYLVIYALKYSKLSIKTWLNFFIFAFILPNLYAIGTYLVKHDYFMDAYIEAVQGLVRSATYHAHGNSLIFIFFSTLFLFYLPKLTRKKQIAAAVALILMGASIFLTFTRGIWGATFISLVILTYRHNVKTLVRFLSVTIPVVGIIIASSPTIQTRLFNSFTSNSDQARSQLIQVHIEMFKEHPIVGIGFWESYRQIADYWPKIGLPANHFESHSHNQYVNVLATTGLVGLFFFTAIFYFFFKKSFKLTKALPKTSESFIFATACLLVLVQFFLACLTDITFEYAKIRGIFVVALGLIVALDTRSKENSDVTPTHS